MKSLVIILSCLIFSGCGASTQQILISPDYSFRLKNKDLLKTDTPLSFQIRSVTDARLDTTKLFSTYRPSGDEVIWTSSEPIPLTFRKAIRNYLFESGHTVTSQSPFDIILNITILEFKVNASTQVTGAEFASCRFEVEFINGKTGEDFYTHEYAATSSGSSSIGFESWIGYLEDALLDCLREIGSDFILKTELNKTF